MIRTFCQHAVRNSFSLDGWWEYVTQKERKDSKKIPSRFPHKAHVPCAWESLPGLESYRGKAWFRTVISGEPGMATRLVFGGVSHSGTVYLDKKKVGHHYDAFTPWDVIITGVSDQDHELIVEIDNTFGNHSALHIGNDYYTYGGITRPVEIQFVPEVFIDNVYATPKRTGNEWELDLRIRLKNWSRTKISRRVSVLLDTMELDLGEVTVPAQSQLEVVGTMPGLNVQVWRPSQPNLYELDVLLWDGDEVVDDLTERVGFREIAVKGNKILFNGKPIRLRGFNRHEDHPHFGCAIPLEAMVKDLNIIEDLGCNFVRTCHYPNDMRFLDLCDEMGFCVWEESHARTVDFKHPKFKEQIENSTREMIDCHYNHPSIIMWGCLNECDVITSFGRKVHENVIKQIRSMDSSRPVTVADNKYERNTAAGLVDIVGWNIYTGWYGNSPEQTGERLDRMLKWLNSPGSKGGKGKPVILSEFGAGGIYGHRKQSKDHWTEEYQARVLEEALKVYLNHPGVCGAAIWQFCDCRVTEENGWWHGRPRTHNNKGVVDEYRRPKLCYDIVKKHMVRAARKWDKG